MIIINHINEHNKRIDNSQILSLPPYTDVTIIDDENKEGLKLKANGNFNLDKDNPPLIYLDGKEISLKELNKIDPNTIERIDVLKGESAAKLQGKKGKNGIIRITLKK